MSDRDRGLMERMLMFGCRLVIMYLLFDEGMLTPFTLHEKVEFRSVPRVHVNERDIPTWTVALGGVTAMVGASVARRERQFHLTINHHIHV